MMERLHNILIEEVLSIILWIFFFGLPIFTPFFLLGGAARNRQIAKGGIVVGLSLAVSYIISCVPLLALLSSSAGFVLGRFLNLDKRTFRFTLLLGLIAALCYTLLPDRLVFLSPLTVNRPTVIRLLIGLLQREQYYRGATLYFQGEPVVEREVTLFGKYPIIVGYPEHMRAPRVEVQFVLSVAEFFLMFLGLWGIMRLAKRGSLRTALLFAGCIFAFTLLPTHGFLLLTVVCTVLIGRYAYRADLVPASLRSLSFPSVLSVFAAYIVLYHLAYAEGCIHGFGVTAEIDWEAVYSNIGVFSLLLGIVIASSSDVNRRT